MARPANDGRERVLAAPRSSGELTMREDDMAAGREEVYATKESVC